MDRKDDLETKRWTRLTDRQFKVAKFNVNDEALQYERLANEAYEVSRKLIYFAQFLDEEEENYADSFEFDAYELSAEFVDLSQKLETRAQDIRQEEEYQEQEKKGITVGVRTIKNGKRVIEPPYRLKDLYPEQERNITDGP